MTFNLKKLTKIIISSIILFNTIVTPVTALGIQFPPPTNINADSVYVLNLDTNDVIYSKNSDEKMEPASLSKMMTAILAVENLELDQKIPFKFYIQDILYQLRITGFGLSNAGLVANEVLTVEQLLHGVLLPSGADASLALADAVGDGSIDYFVEMMNEKAAELGANSTVFANPHGLHAEGQYTTAEDMAIIAQHLMKNDTLAEIVAKPNYQTGPTNSHDNLIWTNTNRLMTVGSDYYYSKADVQGIKTGTTPESGYHLASTATANGYSYLVIVMGGPIYDSEGEENPSNTAFDATIAIYDWLFGSFTEKTILEKDMELDEVSVRLSSQSKFIKVKTAESYSQLLPNDIKIEDIQMIHHLPEAVNAPIEKSQQIGHVELILKGETLATVPLIATEGVTRNVFLFIIDWIIGVTSTFIFKFGISFFVVTILSFIGLMALRNYNNKKYRAVRRNKKL